MPPRISSGTDIGLRLSLLGGKLRVSASHYDSKEQNQVVSISAGNIAGVTTNFDQVVAKFLYAAPVSNPSLGRNARGYNYIIYSLTDRRDAKSKGEEFEIVANLTSRWRLFGNLSLPNSVSLNAYADTRAFIAQNEPVYRQILTDAGVSIDANNVAMVGSVNSGQSAIEAATAWNQIQVFKKSVVVGAQKTSRQATVIANLFTDYTIGEGVLKGLRVGAGINYRGREIIGNHGADLIANPSNPAASIPDPNASSMRYLYAGSYHTETLTLGYNFKLRKRYGVSMSLKVDNLLNYKDVRYVNQVLRPPGGDLNSGARVASPGLFYYVLPFNCALTTTLTF